MRELGELRLRFSLPFVVLSEAGRVRLVAGEDVRYLLEAPALDEWLPTLLSAMDGRRTTAELVATLSAAQRDEATQVLTRLLAERVLAPADAETAHEPQRRSLAIEGAGAVREELEVAAKAREDSRSPALRVLCQSGLDYAALLAFNAECLRGGAPFLWVSTGAVARGFVSPLLLPDAGPCLACLLAGFRRLSPTPEIYDALVRHGSRGEPLPAADFPAPGVSILTQLVLWKAGLACEAMPSAALYSLHVLECATLEVSSHRLAADPECAACGDLR